MRRAVIEVRCQFCGESRAKDRMTAEGVQMALSSYVAHLVESHWDQLEFGRAIRLAAEKPIDDSWTRI